jgi:ferredoxin
MEPSNTYGDRIRSLIMDFIAKSPENTLKNRENEKAFETALVGFSRGDDPIFEAYKEYVGPFHYTPAEMFNLMFPHIHAEPEELTVISWILPHREVTKADNRKETRYPSERWARARIYGEEVSVKLRHLVVSFLTENGIPAFAPTLSPLWERRPSERYVIASTWSERHAAYASGLGTFGLCDGLITPLGKAMRTASVIARVKIPATPRPYTHHQEYCLFFSKGICGQCIPRCPVDALSKSGHDKLKCREYLKPGTADYVKAHYSFDGYGCGLCQTGVPCESKIPSVSDVGA